LRDRHWDPYWATPFDMYVDNAIQCMDILLSGVLARFPKLKFIVSESGAGWVRLPSEFYHRQIFVNSFFERLTDWTIEHVGKHNIMFQTDIPHPPAWYSGGSTDFKNDAVEFAVCALNAEDRHRVLWQNAADLYKDCLEEQGAQSESRDCNPR
jgi:predicted TIM-barrel fold metal-dependent hydrolase